jgi:hypothetical protein
MSLTLAELVTEWDRSTDSVLSRIPHETLETFSELLSSTLYLAEKLYSRYEITLNQETFGTILEDWVSSVVAEEHKQFMLLLLRQLQFVHQEALLSLCRSAYNINIWRWLVDHTGLDLFDPLLPQQLIAMERGTLFCAATDSMPLDKFIRVNQMSNVRDRPCLIQHNRSNTLDGFMANCSARGFRYIVVLDDFVGSGSQTYPILKALTEGLPHCKVLFVPLQICPLGLDTLQKIANLEVSPVAAIPDSQIIRSTEINGPDYLRQQLCKLLEETFTYVSSGGAPCSNPYGFGCINPNQSPFSGVFMVQAHNCPDNAPCMIYHRSLLWQSLFYRIPRGE